MQPQFDLSNINNFLYYEKLSFKCEKCAIIFYIEAKWVKSAIKRNIDRYKYCSHKCRAASNITLLDIICCKCSQLFKMVPSAKKRSKSGNNFCSQSCAAKYNNTHKKTGNRRSKLEIWLETKLEENYKDLEINFNNKEIINSELDIYFPLLNLAFELNGIFHYEPIYGKEKLSSIQNNDNRKFQACLEKTIELVIIDTSSQKYFKEKTSIKYLDIIKNIVDLKLVVSKGLAPSMSKKDASV